MRTTRHSSYRRCQGKLNRELKENGASQPESLKMRRVCAWFDFWMECFEAKC